MVARRVGRAVVVCAWMVVWAVVCAPGCRALPDAGPFVTGTAELKGAVAAGGAAVEQELRLAFDASKADALRDHWRKRNEAMGALLRYAQSLDAIVAAGNDGAASAGRVADAVTGLAGAAGIEIPGSAEALAVASDTVKFVAAQIARARAAGALAASLQEAQPAVERVAALMREDLNDLAVLQEVSSAMQVVDLADEFNKVNSDRKVVLAAMRKIPDPTAKETRQEYEALSQMLAGIEPRYAAYRAKQAEIESRRRVALAVVEASGRSLEEWAAAHAELASAARHGRAVSGQSLVAAATELRDLVKRMRDL